MRVQVKEARIRLLNMRTRMPFKYGIAVMTALPHCFVEVQLEIDGRTNWGLASDGLPPKWFTKNPNDSFADDIHHMLAVIEQACAFAEALPATDSLFTLWQELHAAQAVWAEDTPHPPLLWGLGLSLVERAMIDACCRDQGHPFAEALRTGTFGLRIGELHRELKDGSEMTLLPEALSKLNLRHTVGLADPLTEADIPVAERLDDGLPQSLEDNIARYGLRWFKIKICGDPSVDGPRLAALHRILSRHCPEGYHFTLDGNEQYRDVASFRTLWESMQGDAGLGDFLDHLVFVEQPFHRDVALGDAIAGELQAWVERPPIIIDESDGELASLPRALDCGYAGTSHKNCKGVFKGIANRCLIEQRNRAGAQLMMSGEDLANVGPIALLQDLAVMSVLGIQHVERNGHHYFHGLDFLDASLQQQVIDQHADLYARLPDGVPALRIENGCIQTASVLGAPFGYAIQLDTRAYTLPENWRVESLTD